MKLRISFPFWRTAVCGCLFALTLALSTAVPGARANGCPWPAPVAGEADLEAAIACFNVQTTPGTYGISLTADVTLTGPGTPISNSATGVTLAIAGDGWTLDGDDAAGVRPLTIAPDTTVTVTDLTLTGGSASGSGGGGIGNAGDLTLTGSLVTGNSAGDGAGIYNSGALFLRDSIVSDNTASGDGGGLYNSGTVEISATTVGGNTASGDGGGVYSGGGTVAISGTTFSGNGATLSGGGIYSALTTLTVGNSTLSGNNAAGEGGGIYLEAGSVAISSSTLSDNSAVAGGGLFNDEGAALLNNSVIANSGGGDCSSTVAIDANYALVEDGGCGVSSGVDGNRTGDPNLGPLQDNGGPTWTHLPRLESPLNNAGDNSLAAGLDYDQRGPGYPRLRFSVVDIGAVEYNCEFPVTASTEQGFNGAIGCFNMQTAAGSYTMTLAANISLTADPLDVNNSIAGAALLLEGAGYTVDGGGVAGIRPLTLRPGATATVRNLTLRGGNPADPGGVDGGGIFNEGDLTLAGCTVRNNSAFNGGGIRSMGTLRVHRSTILDNQGEICGGLLSNGPLTISDSTIAGNIAQDKCGGVGSNGGGTIANSTISGNRAGNDGVSEAAGAGVLSLNDLSIFNSTIAANRSAQYSGADGLHIQSGTTTLVNSVIGGNIGLGPDCAGEGTLLATFSLVQDGTCGVVNGVDGNLTGDPLLAALANNGGPTLTHAVAATSPTVDAIPVDGAGPTSRSGVAQGGCDPATAVDQRGFPRAGGDNKGGDACDIGAFEFGSSDPTAVTLRTFAVRQRGFWGWLRGLLGGG